MKKNLITYSLLFVISFSSITTIPKHIRAYEIKKYSNGFVELMWIAPIARYEMVEKTVSDDSVSSNTIE